MPAHRRTRRKEGRRGERDEKPRKREKKKRNKISKGREKNGKKNDFGSFVVARTSSAIYRE